MTEDISRSSQDVSDKLTINSAKEHPHEKLPIISLSGSARYLGRVVLYVAEQ